MYSINPLIILNRAISVTNVGISIPAKNSPTITFLNLKLNRSIINAVIVPNKTLKKMLTIRIIPVFLKPTSRYLSFSTLAKFSKVILSKGGRSRGEVFTISPFVLNAAKRVSKIGRITRITMPMQMICFPICVIVRCFIYLSSFKIRP